MSKVIIGIHGLGNKPAKEVLEEWWILSLKEGLKAIGKQQKLPKLEMVYWADLFYDAPLDERVGERNDPRYMDEPYRIAPTSIRSNISTTRLKILDYLGEKMNKIFLTSDFNPKYTYITEAIVDKFFHEFSAYFNLEESNTGGVRDKIAERLIATLNKYEGDEILVLCHSMGSVIAFDVLSFIIPNAQVTTLITTGSPLGLPNVISKIAEIQRKNGYPRVEMKTPLAVTKSWFNFSDPEDNIAFNYKLSDDFKENSLGVKPTDFLVFNNYVINGERNPHKSYGYLRSSELANVIAEFIGSKQTLWQWFRGVFYKIYRKIWPI
jgi:hypothetical protein